MSTVNFLGYRNGFPFPINDAVLWDMTTYEERDNTRNYKAASSDGSPVCGPGTNYPLGLTFSELAFLYWGVKTGTLTTSISGSLGPGVFPTDFPDSPPPGPTDTTNTSPEHSLDRVITDERLLTKGYSIVSGSAPYFFGPNIRTNSASVLKCGDLYYPYVTPIGGGGLSYSSYNGEPHTLLPLLYSVNTSTVKPKPINAQWVVTQIYKPAQDGTMVFDRATAVPTTIVDLGVVGVITTPFGSKTIPIYGYITCTSSWALDPDIYYPSSPSLAVNFTHSGELWISGASGEFKITERWDYTAP
jgi:hypothetical protein